ncbi:Putative steryl acetyl hydrolase mug81 [Fulvia fulva]|uniref:Steryl acetyl hydrolase mug81 n=1 Tax=Passalora fulva TaxID=5499 RepID=A0A9Q8P8Z9_PASFU|nr:Putative steryl acetyl hydrolase mug81 [Fulvia fulva]KAK4623842.1 putative steryl acetyl hydrolase mug81 [Fulvia fulva]KAK4624928.1 putative steryl acetyl hydrolase mug81 [Fulvia fulva]UJO17537.1 Putative steryl acetyl hydrolase mug81 [Fulvia fulva]WPV14421.1 Putative steryl acetyl hydrolase mug81 [Fulvia fulva]WPV29489.1 Putative steryl acetyl hydrolase mug81 [Fulvia fulva]
MILSQIAWVDCIAFLIFLAPQLLIHVGIFTTLACGIKALPFLGFRMPLELIRERYLTPKEKRSPFVQRATLFQDVVIRCVRYAFADIPSIVGKVFFSKWVSLPFMKFRMLRHGIWKSPIYWREVNREGVKGTYAICDSSRRPDIVLYYCHGGGFSMGSSYFYLEFLMAWMTLLQEAGYDNPAMFALEYTLVPEATYPTQVQEALAGYKYVLSLVNDSSRIVVSGDSAGATLILSLMLCISGYSSIKDKMPGLAIPISPWATIISPKNKNTPSDYLNAESLHLYGSQYIGKNGSQDNALVSPGRCYDQSWWRRASPSRGWYFIYGAEEVFAPEARDLIARLKKADLEVTEHEEPGWIHAWPVVKLFLCNNQDERQSGLRRMVKVISERIDIQKSK